MKESKTPGRKDESNDKSLKAKLRLKKINKDILDKYIKASPDPDKALKDYEDD